MKYFIPNLIIILIIGLGIPSGCYRTNYTAPQKETFEFTASMLKEKTDLLYDRSEKRGFLENISGPLLIDTSKTISLDDFIDKITVVNFWGQWCEPCRSEIFEMENIYNKTKLKKVAFLGVNVRDSNRNSVLNLITNYGITFPSIYDPAMRTVISLKGRYPITSVPSTLILDSKHLVAAVFLREVVAEDIELTISKINFELLRS